MVAILGIVLAFMNCVFYLAINRMPLATVAAIEFVPTIAIALIGVRTMRNIVALAVAADAFGPGLPRCALLLSPADEHANAALGVLDRAHVDQARQFAQRLIAVIWRRRKRNPPRLSRPLKRATAMAGARRCFRSISPRSVCCVTTRPPPWRRRSVRTH